MITQEQRYADGQCNSTEEGSTIETEHSLTFDSSSLHYSGNCDLKGTEEYSHHPMTRCRCIPSINNLMALQGAAGDGHGFAAFKGEGRSLKG
eukprot:756963-Hanusia_phi.AAC.2